MRISCIIIEDEPFAAKKIGGFINDVEFLELKATFNNAQDAINFLKSREIDLIFLDIRMNKISGIQFLETLQRKPKVIITSAYDEYALKGYELNVDDYLLKPFSFNRFLKSVEKVYHRLLEQNKETQKYIFVKTEYRYERVALDEILFVKGMKDYLQIHTTAKKILTLQSFKALFDILPQSEFTRVHNSYLVAVAKIDRIEKNIIWIGHESIPISLGYRETFFSLLKNRKILLK